MKAWNKFCCALASMALLMGSLAAPAFAYGTETEPAPDPAPTPSRFLLRSLRKKPR